MLSTIFWIVFLLVSLIVIWLSFQRVPEANVRLVERLGKYNRTLKPGINFIVPFIEVIKIADYLRCSHKVYMGLSLNKKNWSIFVTACNQTTRF